MVQRGLVGLNHPKLMSNSAAGMDAVPSGKGKIKKSKKPRLTRSSLGQIQTKPSTYAAISTLGTHICKSFLLVITSRYLLV